MIDYHIHTRLCNHAVKSMEAYVQKAIALGFDEICFLDHLITSGDGRRNSMHPNELGLYFQAAQRLKYRYRDRIAVRVGLEIDFQPDQVETIEKIIQPFALDVIGSSVHFARGLNIVSRREKAALSEKEFEAVCRKYLEKVNRMLDFDYFDIICHLDVIRKFKPRLPGFAMEKFDEIISKIRYKGLTVEVNTSGKNHPAQATYPDRSLLTMCFQRDIPITLASDAHHPEQVGQYHQTVLPDLVDIGFTHLSGFSRRTRYQVPIKLNGDC